ncbi:hypothetical protein ABZY44_17125 [Streptomyces sp. NPDC006544]|uniref:hypothetical protein n=1 Tax=Streptomyces sp. NPDC006544 TaxID=3154583 RepID=UPI0033BB04C7
MSRITEQLLSAVEPLPHRERLRLTATTARDLAAAGALDPVLAELDGRGRYERRLAALAAFAGRRTGYLAARLADPDPVVRGYALRAARTRPVPDGAIVAAYADASADVREELGRTARRSGRTALAEALLPQVRAQWGDREAAALLAGCGAEAAARLLPELADAVTDWVRLALRHPGPVLDQAEAELAGLPRELRDSWWARRSTGLAAAAPAEPLRVLGLLERYGPAAPPHALRDRIGLFAAADAERLVRWLIDPAREDPRYGPLPSASVLRRLARADPPSLHLLGRRWLRRPEQLAALFKALPPARREAFYDKLTQGLSPDAQDLAVVLHPLLAPERRYTEARLAVARERAAGLPPGALPGSLANLPVAEARPEILTACGGPDAERRAEAWEMLVANARAGGEAGAVAEVLALIAGRLRNERDPVRSTALTALARLPAALLDSPAAPGHLDAIVLDALRARDSSFATRSAVRTLALGVLDEPAAGSGPFGWALRALRHLVDHFGGALLGGRYRPPGHGRETQVFAALRPWADGAAEKGDFGPLLTLAGFLDTAAARLPELQRMLADALERCGDEDAPALARAWLADRTTREARAVELLAREPSAAALQPVREVLSARRTDLLDVLLAEHPPYGRFLREGSARPLPVLAQASRWLPRQQEAAARLAAAAVRDGSGTSYERTSVIRDGALIPDHGLALVREFAQGTDIVRAEAALAAAARTVEPAAVLDDLLAHAGDDRARVALYAAQRAAAATAPSALAHRLEAVLFGSAPPGAAPQGDLPAAGPAAKVTSRKEAARLAARLLPPGQAAALLGRIGRDPDSHPDLVAVAVRLAVGLLPDAAAWELLETASSAPLPRRLALAHADPLDVPREHRPRCARLVAASVGGFGEDREELLSRAYLGLPKWAAYATEVADTVRTAVCDLSLREASWTTTSALARIAVSDLPHPVGGAEPGSQFHRAVAQLLDVVNSGAQPDAEPDLDLPALRRLRVLVARPPLAEHPSVREAVVRQLADEPLLTEARVALLLHAVDLRADPADPEGLRAALWELVAALRGRPGLARATARDLGSGYAHGDPLPDPASVLECVRGLASDGGAEAGLFASALTAGLGRLHGWPAPWRELLRELRGHPETEVRDTAFEAATQEY